MHKAKFSTVVGDISFGDDGKWASRGSSSPSSEACVSNGGMEQFRDGSREAILWPAEYKTGDMVYPYEAAKK